MGAEEGSEGSLSITSVANRRHSLRIGRPSVRGQWALSGVESRTGAVTVVSRWIFDLAFASPPQSGLAWFCFLFPLIEPDRQISRIRLSEKTHASERSMW